MASREPLRCRWGLHKWLKWENYGFADNNRPVQTRLCMACNKRQLEVR